VPEIALAAPDRRFAQIRIEFSRQLATTTVKSSCRSPALIGPTASKSDAITAFVSTSRLHHRASARGCAPNSSPAAFEAWVMPSLWSARMSPAKCRFRDCARVPAFRISSVRFDTSDACRTDFAFVRGRRHRIAHPASRALSRPGPPSVRARRESRRPRCSHR